VFLNAGWTKQQKLIRVNICVPRIGYAATINRAEQAVEEQQLSAT
jgi:hypothetical protein